MDQQGNAPDPGTITDVTTVTPGASLTDVTAVVPTPALTQPVAPPPAGPRPSRTRWAIAIGGSAVIVLATAAAALALIGRSPTSTVIGYVPEGTVVYSELRLDLPGDQARKVGEFLSHFPGFKDQAALESKLDEVLDDLVADATDDKQTYTKDIEPWFDGELAFGVGPLPDPKTLTGHDPSEGVEHVLALASIKDAALARAWFDAAIKESGATTTSQDYQGTALTVFGGGDDPQAAFAILGDKVAVAGGLDAVKAAVDTNGSGGFAADADVKSALDSADGDHLGLVYVAIKPVLDWSQELGKAVSDELPGLGGGAASSALTGAMLDLVPDWSAYWLRIEGDAVRLETTAPTAKTQIGPTEDRESEVADHVPADSLVLAVTHDTGKTFEGVLDLYAKEPGLKDVIEGLDKALGMAGGREAVLDWVGDTGVVVGPSGEGVDGGLVILPTDAKAAQRLFTSLRNVGGLTDIPGLTFREVQHGDATIVVAEIDLGDAAGLSGLEAGAAPIDGVSLAWAVTDDLVVVGFGQSFVEEVLDTTEATSLASNDRYESLLDRVGEGTGSVFVDLAAIRTRIEDAIRAEDPSALKDYEEDVKPFLEPLDALIGNGSVDGDITRSTVFITVK